MSSTLSKHERFTQMFAHKEISRKVCGPTRSESARHQFGFRPKLSTVTALAHFTDNILQSLDKGGFTGAGILDLSKAFDTVDHVLVVENSRPLELVLKLCSGLPHTLKVGIKSHLLKTASRLNK